MRSTGPDKVSLSARKGREEVTNAHTYTKSVMKPQSWTDSITVYSTIGLLYPSVVSNIHFLSTVFLVFFLFSAINLPTSTWKNSLVTGRKILQFMYSIVHHRLLSLFACYFPQLLFWFFVPLFPSMSSVPLFQSLLFFFHFLFFSFPPVPLSTPCSFSNSRPQMWNTCNQWHGDQRNPARKLQTNININYWNLLDFPNTQLKRKAKYPKVWKKNVHTRQRLQ